MTVKVRTIELDDATAAALEARAFARGLSLQELLAEIAGLAEDSAPDLEGLRTAGRGPWAPGVLAEDARRFADFARSGEGVPFEDVTRWMRSWGTPGEFPMPKPRKL